MYDNEVQFSFGGFNPSFGQLLPLCDGQGRSFAGGPINKCSSDTLLLQKTNIFVDDIDVDVSFSVKRCEWSDAKAPVVLYLEEKKLINSTMTCI